MADAVMTHALHIQSLKMHQIFEMERQHRNIYLSYQSFKKNNVSKRKSVKNFGMLKIIKGYLVNTLIPERLHEMIDRSMSKKNANL